MDVLLVLEVVSMWSSFMVAFFCVQLVAAAYRRNLIKAAAGSSSVTIRSFVSWMARNGVPSLVPLSSRLCGSRRVTRLALPMKSMLEGKGFTTSEVAVCSAGIAMAMASFALVALAAQSIIGGILGVILVFVSMSLWAQSWAEHRSDALRESVPEAIKAMEACSQTGLSLEQMLLQVSKETSKDLSLLFRRGANVLQSGGTASQALECLKCEEGVRELAFVAVALDVQHQTGGSLKQILHSAQSVVEDELKLRRHLQVQTAQARLSARVVTVMPFLLAVLLSLVSPHFLDPFFTSTTGLATLLFALAMQAAGVLSVRHLLKASE